MDVITRIEGRGELIPDYCGRGTVARHWAQADGWMTVATLTVEAGEVFGGDWEDEAHLWIVVAGDGQVSSLGREPLTVRAGDAVRFAGGERRLLRATTRTTVLLLAAPRIETIDTPILS